MQNEQKFYAAKKINYIYFQKLISIESEVKLSLNSLKRQRNDKLLSFLRIRFGKYMNKEQQQSK